MLQSFEFLLAPYPAHERGARSARAGVQAFYRAQAGVPVYPAGTTMECATTAPREVANIFTSEPNLNWYMRGRGQDGLVILKFSSEADRKRCELEWGKLPATHVAERPGGTQYWIFQRRVGDPFFRLNRPLIAGVKAQVSSIAQMPGNKHRSGALFVWREKCAPGEVSLAYLPKSWTASLPRRVADCSRLIITPRHEFSKREARGWDDWNDLNDLR